jgi:HEAT repeat protein
VGVGLVLAAGAGPAWAQGYLGKSVETWASELTSKDTAARRSAAFALGKLGSAANARLPDLVRIAQKDTDAKVREAAAFAVGEICKGNRGAVEGGTVVTAMKEVLAKDPAPLVKRSAAVALGNMGHDAASAQDALERALSDPDPTVRQNAAWALGQVGAGGVDALRKGVRDKDTQVVRDSAKALAQLGGKAHPALADLLIACERYADAGKGLTQEQVEAEKAVLAALAGLVREGDTAAYGPLRKALALRDEESRYNAAIALGNIGGAGAADAVPVLVEVMQKGDPKLRPQAASVLRNIGPAAAARALGPLRAALHDRDAAVREAVAVALSGLGQAGAPAYPDLVKVLANPGEQPAVRERAGMALASIGKAFKKEPLPAVRESVPTFVTLVKDSRAPGKVREKALWALMALREKLEDYPEVFHALDAIVALPKTGDTRMLRYTSAYLLGVFQKDKVSKAGLDVLNEFLHDESLQIFKGTGAVGAGKVEKGAGAGKVVDTGAGDGRKMAVQALSYVGAERLRTRPDIIRQLRALQGSRDPEMREQVQEILKELGD